MREVQSSTIKPEYLNRMAELSSSSWLNTGKALEAMNQAKQHKPKSARRKEFLDTVHQHVIAANTTDKGVNNLNVGISSMKIPQRVEQFNMGMS
jgi:hypothetical protein